MAQSNPFSEIVTLTRYRQAPHNGMRCELVHTTSLQRVHTAILPDIGAVATVLSSLIDHFSWVMMSQTTQLEDQQVLANCANAGLPRHQPMYGTATRPIFTA